MRRMFHFEDKAVPTVHKEYGVGTLVEISKRRYLREARGSFENDTPLLKARFQSLRMQELLPWFESTNSRDRFSVYESRDNLVTVARN